MKKTRKQPLLILAVLATLLLISALLVLKPKSEDFKNFLAGRLVPVPSPSPQCDELQSIQKVKESVVKIITKNGVGSGFVIKKEGYLLTNLHVVEEDPAGFRLVFSDKTTVTGEIFNYDEQTDLAVIKTEKENLKELTFGNSDQLTPGQTVISVGFPYSDVLPGEATVNKGIFSARRNLESEGIELIQIDAPLNPGNSGGPTINSCGEVIGINTAVLLEAQNLGFAISSKTASSMANSLIASGSKDFTVSQKQPTAVSQGQPKQKQTSCPDLEAKIDRFRSYARASGVSEEDINDYIARVREANKIKCGW